jgi:hypothetical protein
MKLRLCAPRCALGQAAAINPPLSTECRDIDPKNPRPSSDDAFEDDDWEEFDPTPLEEWILDDFEWEIEETWPDRGDYWDDSLDGDEANDQ